MRNLIILLALASAAVAVPPITESTPADNTSASDAAKRATVPAGMSVSLWAAEPLLANPVAITFDEKGHLYVAETTRFDHGVPDTRGHMQWLDDDIGSRSVADRLAMYKKFKFGDFEKYDDQIRRVWDSTGKGVADKSTVFAKGFNKPEDGLAAGVLARKGEVWFTCIPSLYRFKDDNGEGVQKETLSTGYGLRVQFLGHDLHGLRMGPDGRIYFSIGDRGFIVKTKEGKTLSNPDSGAVLRCEPDGANLEIVHIGLRNPQKLAFDDFGNLFTFDNNCDSGDAARWVQIVPGGDSGWRCGYQYGTYYHTPDVKQGNRGPWNSEGLWHLQEPGQPAYILPPLAHFGNGPSGIVHYPGIGLNDRYKDHFFACDFTSNPGSSVIWSLAMKPKGASFEVVDLHKFVKNMVPTDCEFGPDSNFYWSDWISGWSPQNKGRIFKVTDAEAQKNPAVKEAKELLAAGMEKMSIDELIKLLEHPHQWVRQEAQFELANRKDADPTNELLAAIPNLKDNLIARVHVLWVLGQRSRQKDSRYGLFLPIFFKDPSPEMHVQALRMIAENVNDDILRIIGDTNRNAIIAFLKDPEPRVRMAAAQALAKLLRFIPLNDGLYKEIWDFAEAAGNDTYLRHAAVMLLSAYHSASGYNIELTKPTTTNQEMILLLAYRRDGDKISEQFLTEYLKDTNIQIADEAARAIYDERMMKALPALAALIDERKLSDRPIAFRALAANFLLGQPRNAERLAEYAARKSEPDYIRAVALKLLADWPNPPRRDPITGLTIDLPPRDAAVAKAALLPHLDAIFIGSDALRKEAVACVRKLGISEVGPVLAKAVADEKLSVNVRVDALYALAEMKAKELGETLPLASKSPEPKLKGAVRTVQVRANPKVAAEFAGILEDAKTSLVEKQMIFASLANLPESVPADELLAAWLDKLAIGSVPPELKLEIVEAAEARVANKKLKLHADLKAKLQMYDKAVKKQAGDKLDKRYAECLTGGDAEHGRAIFLNNAAVYCQRCHKLDGQGGDVGPPLNGIGKEKTRDYILESIVVPNAQIAQGYQSVILNLTSGKTVSGILKKKTKQSYTLITPENKVLEIAADDVESEKPDKSAMPDDLYKKLSKRELRDLVEFLASLKEKSSP